MVAADAPIEAVMLVGTVTGSACAASEFHGPECRSNRAESQPTGEEAPASEGGRRRAAARPR